MEFQNKEFVATPIRYFLDLKLNCKFKIKLIFNIIPESILKNIFVNRIIINYKNKFNLP